VSGGSRRIGGAGAAGVVARAGEASGEARGAVGVAVIR